MAADIFQLLARKDLNGLAKAPSQGADPNAIRSDGPHWTPLHEAIEQIENGGSIEAIVLLLRNGAIVDSWDRDHDSTPLLMAVFRGQGEVVRLLLAAGADPNVTGAEGDTPLRWSVEQGDVAMAALLLRCGANQTIDSSGGASGMTALGRAAYRLDLAMIELLLSAGADSKALDTDRFTAWKRMPQRSEMNYSAWLAVEKLLS